MDNLLRQLNLLANLFFKTRAMSSLIIVFISAILFWAGFVFYARRLERLWQIDAARTTPAISKQDAIDYVPAKHWTILFGHHFASIAGAGPILLGRLQADR